MIRVIPTKYTHAIIIVFSLDSFRKNGKCGTNNNLLNVSGEVRELASWVGSPSCEFL